MHDQRAFGKLLDVTQKMSMIVDPVYRDSYPQSLFCLSNAIISCTNESLSGLLAGKNIKTGLQAHLLVVQALEKLQTTSAIPYKLQTVVHLFKTLSCLFEIDGQYR